MNVLASFVLTTFGKELLSRLFDFLRGNKTEKQKQYEKAFEKTVEWYEKKYNDKYGKKNERFYHYTKTDNEFHKLLLLKPEIDKEGIAAIHLDNGQKTPVSVVEEFIAQLCQELELISDTEEILAKRKAYKNLDNMADDTSEMVRYLEKIFAAISREQNDFCDNSEFVPDPTPINIQKLEYMFRDEYHLDSLDYGHLGSNPHELEQKLDLQQVYIKLDVKDRSFKEIKQAAKVEELSPQQQRNLPLLFQRFDDRLHLEQEKNQRMFQREEKADSELKGKIATIILTECEANFLRDDRVICNAICRDFRIDEQEVYYYLWLLSSAVIVRRPLAEIPQKNNAFLLIGDAGGGKSTACRYMALQCFAQLNKPDSAILHEELGLGDEAPLPVYMRLEDYSAILDKQQFDDKRCLFECAAKFWQRDGEPVFSPAQLAWHVEEKPVWLFLDGLDEVPNPLHRSRLVKVVHDLFHDANNPHMRILLSSRPAAITDELLNTLDIPYYSLLSLEQPQIEDFAFNYFRANLLQENDEQIKKRADGFLHALADVPAAQKLATNPLLLTVVAVLHYKEDKLPRHRAELYDKCIKQLMAQKAESRGKLESGNNIKFSYPENVGKPKIQWDAFEILDVLCDLAFHAFERMEDEVLLDKELLLQCLYKSENVPPSMKKSTELEHVAHDFLELCDRLIGLLAFRGGHYVFVHRTFHEFLAANWISLQEDEEKKNYLEQILQNPVHWYQVIRLLFNRLGKNNPNFGKKLVGIVLDTALQNNDKQIITLAAECLNDFEEAKPQYNLHDQIKGAFITRRNAMHDKPKHFLAYSDALGLMNEPDIDVRHPYMIRLESEQPFEMGGMEDEDEQPIHKVRLAPFWMSPFPVTNRQFAEFINAGGYEDKQFWSDADNPFAFDGLDFLDQLKVGQPEYWLDDRFGRNRPLAPVVGVSWYEAMAYCRWWTLTFGELETEQGMQPGVMRLPTEAEWECACRAGTRTPFNTGENLTTEQANYDGNYPYKDFPKGVYLEQTTTVGSYAPNDWGLYDMHGNVYEWCLDWFDEDFYNECEKKGTVENPVNTKKGSHRVRRGGSWDNSAQFCRSANRSRFVPDDRINGIGFRLVFVPQF